MSSSQILLKKSPSKVKTHQRPNMASKLQLIKTPARAAFSAFSVLASFASVPPLKTDSTGNAVKMSKLDLKSLPEPGNKYKLGLKIGGGVGGEVFEALENQTGKKVAIKIIDLKKETEDEIQQEYNVLKQMSANENFPEFYGIYSKQGKDNTQKIWLVMEYCDGGEATSLVRKLQHDDKKMNELHIAYIIRETIKAVIHLHEGDISHRDIRGSNILLTADGTVKLVDYGISKRVDENEKMRTCVGSPSWLAPEVISCQTEEGSSRYDKKADVWAVGITAIELGDGQAPFEDIHPGRALFQITNNPPPTLRKPSDWSQIYNDFISECLVKNHENRPFVQEFLVHPFFEPLDKEENLVQDLSELLKKYKNTNLYTKPEVQIREGLVKTAERPTPEKILHEDLAAMTKVSEDSVLSELHEKHKRNEFHTFIGDILLILNSNKTSDIYGLQHHKKYSFKAKSQNAPHIYSIADSAYRDVFHHEKPQYILFSGETGAGKTANMIHATDHLLFLGQGLKTSEKVTKALAVIHAMGNASTPHNDNSTRHVLQTQMTFTDTGKVSGAVFRVYLLEKERVTMMAKKQANFHLFHYFYDKLNSENKLREFYLTGGGYNFLETESSKSSKENAAEFKLFEKNLTELEFDKEQIRSINKILAAILLLGELQFVDGDDGNGVLASPETVKKVADLLGVDKKKLSWALLNYCLISNGEAVMRHNSKQEADEAKNVLARGLYSRLVDWVVNAINEKISVCRAVYGDRHVVSLLDLYGFECYKRNTLNQLFVNTINEQLQFQYNQKIFTWDKQTAEVEEIPFPNLEFKDNKILIDLILSKPDGLLHKLDEATRNEDSSDLLDNFKTGKDAPIFAETTRQFSITHYTGKLTYDASDMTEKNRDFLPPEIIDTMRLSTQEVVKQLFSSLLSKSGNLSRERRVSEQIPESGRNKKNVTTAPSGHFSQSRQMRTAATTFRGACADLFKNLTNKECGFHYVRCIRTDLSGRPGAFDPEVVRQQLRALAVVNTILTTQKGYSYSVFHEEFIRRYKFLAFDFDENVDETKDNCRLLLLRLKLEGWTMGKTKVFLKYYNKEYLSRLYEMQIKKIVKVQSMMRAFMARRKLYAKIKRYQGDADVCKFIKGEDTREAKAASIIQKRFREYASSKSNLTESQKEFIRPWYKRWRTKSIFQVLLLYRAERLQALVNFCLQIHLYNQNCLSFIQRTNVEINLENVDTQVKATEYLPPLKPPIPKLLFLWKSLNPRCDIADCEPLPDYNIEELEAELRANLTEKTTSAVSENTALEESSPKSCEDKEIQTSLNEEKLREDVPTVTISRQDVLPKIILTKEEDNAKKEDSIPTIIIQDEEKIHSTVTEKKDIVPTIKNEHKEENKKPPEVHSETVEAENHDIQNLPGQLKAKTQSTVAKEPKPEDERQEITPKPRNNAITISRPPPVKPRGNSKPNLVHEQKFKTSINEMEAKFKNKDYNENSEEPPFNFRSLLRKTNYTAIPRRSVHEDLAFRNEIEGFSFAERKKSLSCGKMDKIKRPENTIVAELVPGILIYGKITDL